MPSVSGMVSQFQAQSTLTTVHPHLKAFVSHPENEILRVRIKSFLLLNGLTEAHYAALE